jgi:hypothetical protein
LNTESIPLLDNSVPGLGITASKGALAPVTGLAGSTSGAVKGALGSTTGTLNGLLGGTPVGGLVNGLGNVGTGLTGGLLDSVGGAGGGLGLGQILKPVTGTVGGLLNGFPIVGPIAGPIAGGLTDTLGGLSLQGQGQVGQMNVPSDPSQAQYPVPGMGTPSTGLPITSVPSAGTESAFMTQAQGVQEQVVGNLGGGSFLTNTGRIVSLLPAGTGLNGAASSLTGQLPGLTGNGPLAGLTGPLAGLTGNGGPLAGLPVQVPSGLPGLDGLGQALRPVTSNPLAQAPLTSTPLGQNPLDLGNLANIVSNLPPGLSQIVQPVGSPEKFLQIGNQLIPLGAMDPTRLAQLGLDKLPVSTVNNIPGMASINYLQDQDQDQGQGTGDESKEVMANPVTTWMNEGDAASNSTMPAATTPAESTDSTPTAGAGDAGSEPSASGAPQIAQLNVSPLYVAPTPSNAAGQIPMPKGYTQWSEVSLNEGETFDRIADGMSGRERNYYNGADKPSTTMSTLPSTTPTGMPSALPSGTAGNGNGTTIEDGPAPDFHANKGRLGWQLSDESSAPSITPGWHHPGPSATPTGTNSMSSAVRAGPTAAPVSDAGTYAWDEDWGDWVGAGMDDMGLNVGWDDMGPYEDPLPSSVQGRGAGGSQMYPQPSAGLS